MLRKYKVTFEAYVEIEAKSGDEAIRLAWLQKNIDTASYKYKSIKVIE